MLSESQKCNNMFWRRHPGNAPFNTSLRRRRRDNYHLTDMKVILKKQAKAKFERGMPDDILFWRKENCSSFRSEDHDVVEVS